MPKPVIICIGTNNVVGDSLGPCVGDILIMNYNIDAYVYGHSSRPINGLNYGDYMKHIRLHHKKSLIIAVDACVGKTGDIGKIKYSSKGLIAGGALNKGYGRIGDIGILGVVAASNQNNLNVLMQVENSLINAMSVSIAGIVQNIIKMINNFEYNVNIINIHKTNY